MSDAGKHGNAVSRDWFKVRDLRQSDRGRVVSDYVRSLRRNACRDTWAAKLEQPEYDAVTNQLADTMLEHGRVRIAADAAAPDHIVGWLVSEPGTLHYAFVVERFRGRGVFAALYADAGLGEGAVITHLTYSAVRMRKRYGWRYEPIYTGTKETP